MSTCAGERPRNAQLVRLDQGHTPQDLFDAIAANTRWPEWATYVGGPGLTEPGRSMSYEVDLEVAQVSLETVYDLINENRAAEGEFYLALAQLLSHRLRHRSG